MISSRLVYGLTRSKKAIGESFYVLDGYAPTDNAQVIQGPVHNPWGIAWITN